MGGSKSSSSLPYRTRKYPRYTSTPGGGNELNVHVPPPRLALFTALLWPFRFRRFGARPGHSNGYLSVHGRAILPARGPADGREHYDRPLETPPSRAPGARFLARKTAGPFEAFRLVLGGTGTPKPAGECGTGTPGRLEWRVPERGLCLRKGWNESMVRVCGRAASTFVSAA